MFKLMSTINKCICLVLMLIAVICLGLSAKAEASEHSNKLTIDDATHAISVTFTTNPIHVKSEYSGFINYKPTICAMVDYDGINTCTHRLTLKEYVQYKIPGAQYLGFRISRGRSSDYIDIYAYLDENAIIQRQIGKKIQDAIDRNKKLEKLLEEAKSL